MSLRVSWAEIVCVLALLFLSACQQSITGGVVVEQNDGIPKDVVITSQPQPSPQQAQPKAAESSPVWIPENVLPGPEREVIVIPESKPSEDPVQDCIDDCMDSCTTSAGLACAQSSGAACKQQCGGIIDPSACSTACSLRSARMCEPKFAEYCTSTCGGRCH